MATVALTFIALLLAISVKSIYSLMINSWASQLVVIFIPVVTALYVPKASKNAAWAAMAVSTGVWLAYVFVDSSGTGLSFTELMNTDLDRSLTVGAVYGFAARRRRFHLLLPRRAGAALGARPAGRGGRIG